jgi:predicted hydrolase (HD superfamily)
MKILILDDSEDRMERFKEGIERLKSQGVTVWTTYVYNQNTAMRALDSQKDFDYIFLDHDLDNEQLEYKEENNGLNVVDYLIKINYKKDVNIVIHSWNIVKGCEMKRRLENAGYSPVQQPGAWNLVGT